MSNKKEVLMFNIKITIFEIMIKSACLVFFDMCVAFNSLGKQIDTETIIAILSLVLVNIISIYLIFIFAEQDIFKNAEKYFKEQ